MSNTPDYLIYFEMPTYLAQWYANMCLVKEHAEDEAYAPEIYRFNRDNPVGVKPGKGSAESKFLKLHVQKQPTVAPEPIPENATIAVVLPWYKDVDKRTYNYVNEKAKGGFVTRVKDMFDVDLYDYVMRNKEVSPKMMLQDILLMFASERGMDWFDDTVEYSIKKSWQRVYKCTWARDNRNKKKKK